MKIIQMSGTGGPDVLQLAEADIPKPGPGEVLIKTHAIGVGHFDLLIRTGRYPWMPPLPYVPGNEMSGRVIDGNGSGLRQGEAVYVANWDIGYKGGFYAEYLVAPADAVRRLPDDADLDRAAALSNYTVAACLLDNAVPGHFETLAVHGAAGGMGMALVDLARLAGASVIGIAGGDSKCEAVRKSGAQAIDHQREDVVARVLDMTAHRGVDVVCNHMAGETLARDLKMVAAFGTLVSYGALHGLPQNDLFRDMRANIERSPAVRCFTMHTFDHAPDLRDLCTDKIVGLFGARKIRPVLDRIFPLSQAADAHRALEERTVVGKLLLRP